MLLQTLRWTGVIDLNIGAGSQIQQATWSHETKVIVIQSIEIVGYVVTSLLMITLSFVLMITLLYVAAVSVSEEDELTI